MVHTPFVLFATVALSLSSALSAPVSRELNVLQPRFKQPDPQQPASTPVPNQPPGFQDAPPSVGGHERTTPNTVRPLRSGLAVHVVNARFHSGPPADQGLPGPPNTGGRLPGSLADQAVGDRFRPGPLVKQYPGLAFHVGPLEQGPGPSG